MSFEPKSTDMLDDDNDDDFVVVVGVFAPRDFVFAQERYPSLAGMTAEAYAKDIETLALSMIDQGAEVEICVLDIDEYDDWCHESALDPDRSDSRAKFVATFKPSSYPFGTSIARVLDCEYATYLAYRAYEDVFEVGEGPESSDALDDHCVTLMATVGNGVTTRALVSVEAVVGDDETEFGMSFIVQIDDEGDLCMVHELDHMGLSAMLHVGMLRGGAVYVRELQDGVCTLRGYDLGTRQWAAASDSDVADWRGNRDAAVRVAGGQLSLRSA